jgi:hypothetical protein
MAFFDESCIIATLTVERQYYSYDLIPTTQLANLMSTKTDCQLSNSFLFNQNRFQNLALQSLQRTNLYVDSSSTYILVFAQLYFVFAVIRRRSRWLRNFSSECFLKKTLSKVFTTAARAHLRALQSITAPLLQPEERPHQPRLFVRTNFVLTPSRVHCFSFEPFFRKIE